jgi:hypothetical protein
MNYVMAALVSCCMLTVSASGASAWYCSANGWGGSGRGRSESRVRATYISLYECSRRGSYCRVRACMP